MIYPFKPNALAYPAYQCDVGSRVLVIYFDVFFFIFYYKTLCKQTVKILIGHQYAVSDLGLHRLAMAHKKYARRIYVGLKAMPRRVWDSAPMRIDQAVCDLGLHRLAML